MFRQSLVLLPLLVCLTASPALRGEEADAKQQDRFPALQKPVAEVVEIDLKIAPDAANVTFEKGKCVVVTGLVPWRDGLQIINFKLQRQEFAEKPTDTNNERWEAVDIKDSIDVVFRAADFQADLLPRQLTNPVITEPLPRLKTGDWPAAVVHPALRKSLNDPPENTLQFRYLDFDVKPQHFYRYRVRLEYINPDYDETIHPSSDQTVSSEWSKPTKLIRIQPAQK